MFLSHVVMISANSCRNSSRPIPPSTGCSWTSCNGSSFTIPNSVLRPSKLCRIHGSKSPLSTTVPKLSGSVNNCSVGVGSRLACRTDPPRVCCFSSLYHRYGTWVGPQPTYWFRIDIITAGAFGGFCLIFLLFLG